MRTFPLLYLMLFLLIYLLLTFAAYKSLKKTVKDRFRKVISYIYWIFSVAMLLVFLFIYVYPYQPSRATNYPVYFYFNFILFTDFVAKTPLTVALVLQYVFRKQNSNTILWSGLIMSVGFSLLLIYGVVLGQENVRIKQFEIQNKDLPAGFHDYKIVQISDTHLGSFLKSNNVMEKTVSKILKINPDVIFFTGDMVNNFSKEMKYWVPYFKEITKNRVSYSILGNHDYGDYMNWDNQQNKQENFRAILERQREMGFQLLLNENTVLRSGEDSVFLAGVENWGHPPFPQYAELEKAMDGIPKDAFTILLTHDPAHWEAKVKNMKEIDLVLAGHSHGLQWGIKPAGIPLSLVYFVRANWSGMYKSENTLIVNTGLGLVGVPWRIDMPPEITVITLKRGEIKGK